MTEKPPNANESSKNLADLTVAELKKLEVRHNPNDNFYSIETGQTLKNYVQLLIENREDLNAGDLDFLGSVSNGPASYLEMPDRYDLEELRNRIGIPEIKEQRKMLPEKAPEIHELLERQRIRINIIQQFLQPIVLAMKYRIGNQSDVEDLMRRYEMIGGKIRAKESAEEVDHRTMTLDQKV